MNKLNFTKLVILAFTLMPIIVFSQQNRVKNQNIKHTTPNTFQSQEQVKSNVVFGNKMEIIHTNKTNTGRNSINTFGKKLEFVKNTNLKPKPKSNTIYKKKWKLKNQMMKQ